MGPVLAPPYDVVSPGHIREFLARSPYNVLRLDLGLRDGEIDRPGNWAHARSLFEQWRNQGWLVADPEPCVYVVRHHYRAPDGSSGVLTGVLVGLRVGAGPERAALPHERTVPEVWSERLQQLEVCRIHFSPILALVGDPAGQFQEALHKAASASPEWEDESPIGGLLQLWVHRASDPAGRQVLDALATRLAEQPAVIADGHHRFEAASRFARAVQAGDGSSRPGPEQYVLAALTPDSGGLAILPIHRVVGPKRQELRERLRLALYEAMGALSPAELAPQLAERVAAAASDPRRAAETVRELRSALHRPVVAVYWGSGELEFLAEPAKAAWHGGSPRSDLPGAAADVLLLHRGPLAGFEPVADHSTSAPAKSAWVRFTPQEAEALQAVDAGQAACAILLAPVSAAEVREVALAGKKLPEKSTYFYPKMASGLVLADMALEVLPWRVGSQHPGGA